ncbi:hypothetical protein SKAU_G00391730 [Synaphobranchus kaupii]|uniref:Uncharacterized protein n=1 Tax=Synaphobranchus kaupii TaxID=118154 RepID=A0A9Q1EBQ2_SYNKA|nr:hypothetical protein SKAU_G00391730 [Synaphobranchus kaupii]
MWRWKASESRGLAVSSASPHAALRAAQSSTPTLGASGRSINHSTTVFPQLDPPTLYLHQEAYSTEALESVI